jgi:serine/threonine-protein kinase
VVIRVESIRPKQASLSSESTEPALIGQRYRAKSRLGQGGMAVVYEVTDTVTGRTVALKRLHAQSDARKQRRSVELFEREFHTLAQLAHPRIVEVYDYAVDERGPYYTMELLSGGDLQQLVPMDYRQACAVARDVCSALSLLHSRLMVHRDLSPRNVRCTAEGIAKLIDFGAMVPMGRNKYVVVGTPAYCAPEVVNAQPLDARTDLYGLGATLYYTLTGKHAYPAKDFPSLVGLWQCGIPSPSHFVSDIPEALDALVMDLLCLDPSARPANAAEVMMRLAAIDGQPLAEQLLVAQSYLSTPTLAGREVALARSRAQIRRALRRRGGALLVDGPSGVGRSRFLDAFVLEAKILGATVLRADKDDAQSGDYGVVQALARQVLEAMPDVATEEARAKIGVLGHAVPALLGRISGAELAVFADPSLVRPQLQPALREWFLALARSKPIAIAVDDVQGIDEPSAALLALLANDLREHAMVVLATVEAQASSSVKAALDLFARQAHPLSLGELGVGDAEKLLASVFGEVPHVGLLAHRLHQISSGNPRDLMRLAQHLVDRGVIRYEGGAWSVPAAFDAADLPSSMAQALKARVDVLSPPARDLARTIALDPGLVTSLDELLAVSGRGQLSLVMSQVDELVKAGVLRSVGEHYALAQDAWAHALVQDQSEEETRAHHRRLQALFERRGTDAFRVGQHMLRSGDAEAGARMLARHAQESQEVTGRNPDAFFKLLTSLPADWLATYEEALVLAKSLPERRRMEYHLRGRLAGFAAMLGTRDPHTPDYLAQLTELSGLGDWMQLDPSMDPRARIKTALGQASARHASAAESDQVLAPMHALPQLARAVTQGTAMAASGLDVPFIRSLPSVAVFTPLSPSFWVIDQLVQGLHARMTGRTELAIPYYSRLLTRLGEPDRGGLDESHHKWMQLGVMNGLGLINAAMGHASSLDWASRIEHEPSHQVNAVQIRMLYHLFQGDIREAVRNERQVELLRIQNSARQWFEGSHLLPQIIAYALSGDLTRIKQTAEEIQKLSERYPCWIPVLHYATGEYHRARGGHAAALSAFEIGLELAQPGEHQVWPNLASAHLRTLHELGRLEEALALAERYVGESEHAEIGCMANHVRRQLAMIQGKLGKHAEAVGTADGVIASFTALGSTGLNLGVAHETRARVALLADDREAFDHHAALCSSIFTKSGNPALVAKSERLRQDSQKAQTTLAGASGLLTDRFQFSRIASALDACKGFAERAQAALGILADASGAVGGFLYLLGDQGPFYAAQLGSEAPPDAVRALAQEYLTSEVEDADMTTDSHSMPSTGLSTDWAGWAGELYRPVLLSHEMSGQIAITGVAVLTVASGSPFVAPSRVATDLSRRIQQVGDVTAIMVAS